MLRTDRFARVVLVTSGLSGTGALVGALCGAVAVGIIVAIENGAASLLAVAMLQLIGVAAVAGAFAGIVGAPLLAWGVLRRVPLGRAIAVTAVGTVLGAVVGEITRPLNPYAHVVPGVLAGALLGFVLSGIGLRFRMRPAAQPPSREPYNER